MVVWLWREQRKVGTAVGEVSFAARLGIPVKSLYRRVETIPAVQAVIDGRKGHWCYYVRRDPASAGKADPGKSLRPGRAGSVSEVRA